MIASLKGNCFEVMTYKIKIKYKVHPYNIYTVYDKHRIHNIPLNYEYIKPI